MPQASLPLGVAGALHDRVPEVLDGGKSPSSKIVAPACLGVLLAGRPFSCARQVFASRFRLGRKQQGMHFTGYRFLIIGHLKILAVASASLQRSQMSNQSIETAGRT